MAATLLACGGAGLIAGAPDWISRIALAKAAVRALGITADAQAPKSPTKDGLATTVAEGNGPAQPQLAGPIRSVPTAKGATLHDQLDLEHFVVARTCGGGTPRFERANDLEGDGVSNGNASGSVGNPPRFAGCDAVRWSVEDPAEDVPRSSHDLVTVESRTLDDRQDTVR